VLPIGVIVLWCKCLSRTFALTSFTVRLILLSFHFLPSRLTCSEAAQIQVDLATYATALKTPRPDQPRHHEQACSQEREQCEGGLNIWDLCIRCLCSIQRCFITALICLGTARPLDHFGPKRRRLLQEPVEAGQHNQGKGAGGYPGTRRKGAGGGGLARSMGAFRTRMYIQCV
jgi:hypothetical protein